MIELNQLTVLIAGEVLVGLLVLCGVLVLFALLRKGRIRKAAQHLAERVQGDKPQRSERLKALLASHYGYEGGELEQTLHNITQAEMRLYQNIINGFLKDDQVFLQQVDVDVENLVLSYQMLKTPDGTVAEAPQSHDAAESEEELQHLKEENERLSDELKVTMDTMGRMLNEYSTMFAGGADNTFEKVAPEPAPIPDSIVAEGDVSIEVDESAAELTEPPSAADAAVEISEPVTTDVEPQESAVEIDIPDFEVGDVVVNDTVGDEMDSSDADEESANAVDEEVSEIIDEVMGIADEMTQEELVESVSEDSAAPAESLMDEVAQVDIDIPEIEGNPLEAEEGGAGSLEEEWAKLLEEDAASHDEKKEEQ
ncbi:MAG: hypothetical protein KZQ77_17525 [Candidatus Thiodiazotropha sp. (ex Notomyrtea botanica)]|nr:hypothetical protein [Candidatus Thiodiazotropha sp. (ex Notomyrtea botanica)]